MKNINGLTEFHGVDRAIGIAAVVLDDFQNPGTFSFPRLRFRMLAPKLRHTQGDAYFVLRRVGKVQQVVLCRSHPKQGLFARNPRRSCHLIIPVLGWDIHNLFVTQRFSLQTTPAECA